MGMICCSFHDTIGPCGLYVGNALILGVQDHTELHYPYSLEKDLNVTVTAVFSNDHPLPISGFSFYWPKGDGRLSQPCQLWKSNSNRIAWGGDHIIAATQTGMSQFVVCVHVLKAFIDLQHIHIYPSHLNWSTRWPEILTFRLPSQ